MKKIKIHARRIALAFIMLVIILAASFKIYTSNYYREDKGIVDEIADEYKDKVNAYSDENGMVFIPHGQEIKAVIVFYPGGKVEYTSYSGFMYELASRGIVCILPRMPENLAFLRVNAVEVITGNRQEETSSVGACDWYLAGHSLGGVAASTYISEHAEDYTGLILCGSYPSDDLSDKELRLLSIYGSEDHVINMENYENAKSLWPSDSTEFVIYGGIHSYFGSYGIQDGDGEPTITNREQMQKAADIIVEWIEKSDVDPEGTYDSKEDVALYLQTFGKLPSNYMTKKEAKKLGWTGGSLEEYAPGMCIGGDYFGNYEGKLPQDKTYHECDIDTRGKSSRGAKRIIYSDDGYIYYTEDHYETFELLYEPVE
ncbi:Guanyl-specific ribonuclease Sa [Butyrivibrio sp. INlla18]|uniref:alpha/beta hydrolase n=1 Tax=Butyrivibrio sp. INlla18 TaxID=1520806 RepID=UPI00087F8034|nr:alpha/beta hydrolase [Butyrivibrio sp. INlla18]SDA49108.1 Guanyl-specific ribonuclease Sa [Butyrivibrio sp. INlla18]